MKGRVVSHGDSTLVDALLAEAGAAFAPAATEVERLISIPGGRILPRPVDFDEAALAGGDLALRGSNVWEADFRLAQAAAAGDQDAWAKIVSLYSPTVRAIAFKSLPKRLENDRDDVVQEIFIKVYAGLPSYMGLALLKTWISQIALRHLMNRTRDTKRRAEHEVLESQIGADDTAVSLDEMAVSPEPSPWDNHGARERQQLALRIFREVDEPYRLAIVLTTYCGCSHEETAKLLRIEPGTVKSRVSRGRKQITDKLRAAGIDH